MYKPQHIKIIYIKSTYMQVSTDEYEIRITSSGTDSRYVSKGVTLFVDINYKITHAHFDEEFSYCGKKGRFPFNNEFKQKYSEGIIEEFSTELYLIGIDHDEWEIPPICSNCQNIIKGIIERRN